VKLLPAIVCAKFVMVFGGQGTLLILMDANFSGTFIPLVGERVENRRLIAGYVASLRQLSVWTYALSGCGALFCYLLMVRNRHWSWATIVAMITSTVPGVLWLNLVTSIASLFLTFFLALMVLLRSHVRLSSSLRCTGPLTRSKRRRS